MTIDHVTFVRERIREDWFCAFVATRQQCELRYEQHIAYVTTQNVTIRQQHA